MDFIPKFWPDFLNLTILISYKSHHPHNYFRKRVSPRPPNNFRKMCPPPQFITRRVFAPCGRCIAEHTAIGVCPPQVYPIIFDPSLAIKYFRTVLNWLFHSLDISIMHFQRWGPLKIKSVTITAVTNFKVNCYTPRVFWISFPAPSRHVCSAADILCHVVTSGMSWRKNPLPCRFFNWEFIS